MGCCFAFRTRSRIPHTCWGPHADTPTCILTILKKRHLNSHTHTDTGLTCLSLSFLHYMLPSVSSQPSKIKRVSSFLCLLQHSSALIYTTPQMVFGVFHSFCNSLLSFIPVLLKVNHSLDVLLNPAKFCTSLHFRNGQKHHVCIGYCVLVLLDVIWYTNYEWLLENRASLCSLVLIIKDAYALTSFSSTSPHINSCSVCNYSNDPGLKMNESLIYAI